MRRYYIAFLTLVFAACSSLPDFTMRPEITKESVSACIYKVHNRGLPPFEVVKDIVESIRETPLSVFSKNQNFDVYSSVAKELGPYRDDKHRAAVLGAVMVVQSGFESSWDYYEGRDMSANNTSSCTQEAGLYQTSGNLNTFNAEAKATLQPFMREHCSSVSCDEFIRCTKAPVKEFVHGHFIRASRITVRHWGPMVRKEINPWLKKECVNAIEALL